MTTTASTLAPVGAKLNMYAVSFASLAVRTTPTPTHYCGRHGRLTGHIVASKSPLRTSSELKAKL
eukprot:571833-Alexandrium_andersonii.AAC.1